MPATLTDQQVERMRATHQEALPDRVTILRRERRSDGVGGYIYDFLPLDENVPARIGLATYGGGGEIDTRSVTKTRLIDEEAHLLALPAETDIAEQDRVENLADGTIFEVIDILKRGEWELGRRCRILEHG